MIWSNKRGGDSKKMYLRCWPLQWSWRCNGAIQTTSPNVACPGLHWKPLDAAIGRLLAPYCPGCRQGNSKQNNNDNDEMNQLCWPLQFGHRNLAVWYQVHCPMEEVQLDTPIRQALASIASMVFLLSNLWKRPQGKRVDPNNNNGIHTKLMRST